MPTASVFKFEGVTTITGSSLPAASNADACDAAATVMLADLLLRVDPRDFAITAANPTGKGTYNAMAPNPTLDAAFFTGTGVSIGPITGKYNAQSVFILTKAGSIASGTGSDLKVAINSFTALADITIVGCAHIDPDLYADAGNTRFLFGFLTGGSVTAAIVHQYSSPNDFLAAYSNGLSGGSNINITTNTAPPLGVTQAVPFVYVMTIRSSDASVRVFFNQLTTPAVASTGKSMPTAGAQVLAIGNGGASVDASQWHGAHGRMYVFGRDMLRASQDITNMTALVAQMKNLYGVS